MGKLYCDTFYMSIEIKSVYIFSVIFINSELHKMKRKFLDLVSNIKNTSYILPYLYLFSQVIERVRA